MPRPRIDVFVLGDFQTNCHVVSVEPGDGRDCWIVDCGYDPGVMLDAIEERGLEPRAIILTHAHADHMAGVDAALARFGPLPLYLHEAERGFCSDPMLNLSGLLGLPVTCTEPDRWLRDGEELDLAGTRWTVRHAPGHSPGGVLLVHEPSRQAIVGDTLFAGSIGRIDFPTSSPDDMRRSLFDVLLALPDDMRILPGHGPATTIGAERASNPFLVRGTAVW